MLHQEIYQDVSHQVMYGNDNVILVHTINGDIMTFKIVSHVVLTTTEHLHQLLISPVKRCYIRQDSSSPKHVVRCFHYQFQGHSQTLHHQRLPSMVRSVTAQVRRITITSSRCLLNNNKIHRRKRTTTESSQFTTIRILAMILHRKLSRSTLVPTTNVIRILLCL